MKMTPIEFDAQAGLAQAEAITPETDASIPDRREIEANSAKIAENQGRVANFISNL